MQLCGFKVEPNHDIFLEKNMPELRSITCSFRRVLIVWWKQVWNENESSFVVHGIMQDYIDLEWISGAYIWKHVALITIQGQEKWLTEAIYTGVINGSYLLGVINGSNLRDPRLFV
jgi:hypothetical protein